MVNEVIIQSDPSFLGITSNRPLDLLTIPLKFFIMIMSHLSDEDRLRLRNACSDLIRLMELL
jgi:hypothetical protein